MAKSKTRIATKLTDMVQLISEEDVSGEMGEAFASYMLNPTVVWAKFTLTDDMKNANGQRVPSEEFDNLIKSGIHMPIKMSAGAGKKEHRDSEPLGVITHLKKLTDESGRNIIIALAALWGQERPEDVKVIRDRFQEGHPVDVSWEILYDNSIYNTAQASEDLQGTVLRAATIVDNAAYQGRTQFLTVSAKKWSPAYIEKLPDSSFLYIASDGTRMFPIRDNEGRIEASRIKETLEALNNTAIPDSVRAEKAGILNTILTELESGKTVEEVTAELFNTTPNVEEVKVNTVEELQAEVARLTAELNEKPATSSATAEKDAEIARLTELNKEQETELKALREFKAEIDSANEKKAKLEEVKNKFVEAGIDKDEEFYTENAEKLIAMDSSAVEFMIQEIKAFSESSAGKKASASKTNKIPAISGDGGTPSKEELVNYLRTMSAKKN